MEPEIFFDAKFTNALAARTGEPIVTDQDVTEAQYSLSAVFELVRYHGLSTWTVDDMPGVAYQVLVEAAARLFMNLGGFVSERADGTQLERADEFAAGASLTDAEIARLEDAAGKNLGKGALRSVGLRNSDLPVHRSEHPGWGHGWVQPVGPYFSVNQPPIPYMPGDENTNLVPWSRPFPGGWYA